WSQILPAWTSSCARPTATIAYRSESERPVLASVSRCSQATPRTACRSADRRSTRRAGSGSERAPRQARPAGCRLFVCGHPRGEELRLVAAELCPHRLVRGTEDFAGDGGGGHERVHEVADVGEMLQSGVGVAVPLEDDRLALVVV